MKRGKRLFAAFLSLATTLALIPSIVYRPSVQADEEQCLDTASNSYVIEESVREESADNEQLSAPTPTMFGVKMPDVVGKNYHDAEQEIREKFKEEGFTAELEIRICWVHNNDPELTCKVKSQDPEAGKWVLGNERHTFTLYVAEQGITPTPSEPTDVPTPTMACVKMPDVVGMNHEDAKKYIEDVFHDAGFTAHKVEVRINMVSNHDIENDQKVIGQDPEADIVVYDNNDVVITLTVSVYIPPTPTMACVKMPDVVGMRYEEAQKEVEDKLRAGGYTHEIRFSITWVHNVDPDKTCTVVQQDPEAETIIYNNKDLVVSFCVAEQGVTPTPVTPTPGDPTPVTPAPVTPVPGDPDKEPSIADFVERLYTIALNRESEPEGKAFWVKEIEDGNRTGGDCAYFFLIEAPEFKNRGLGDEDFVETLYKTFFDRASEAEGKAFWVGQLKNKTMTRDQVIMGFIDSKEWCNVCATYGVKSGAPTAKAEFASKNAINFATRLYTCCLGREADEGGLKYWSLALTNLEQTGCSAAKDFFTSQEFVNLKLKDDEFVNRLYKTFMDREPEAGEVAYWTGEIAKGTQTRDSVLAFFGQSEEFTNICKKYGIDRGNI